MKNKMKIIISREQFLEFGKNYFNSYLSQYKDIDRFDIVNFEGVDKLSVTFEEGEVMLISDEEIKMRLSNLIQDEFVVNTKIVLNSTQKLDFGKVYLGFWKQDRCIEKMVFVNNHTAGNGLPIMIVSESDFVVFADYKDWESVKKDFYFIAEIN